MQEDWVETILSFWFGELTEEDWFTRSDANDRAIKAGFEPLYREIRANIPAAAFEEPRAALAATIALDQFPRNMFRGAAEAFATDDQAIDIARKALARKLDEKLSEAEKQFLYMPFMHSEILADQEHSVALFRAQDAGKNEKFAVEHRDIVAKFGRFPHRNKVLGRESTPAERVFLLNHQGFGQ
ncbi:MAG: DUF924 domain-containing protein [Hyphomicrobiales bacterium]|nr:DUF924 domain-containing protein [Hyphomicrobiales bacterium]